MATLVNFSDLIPLYDSFILDIWGVIHDGVIAYPGVIDCVNNLVKMKKNICFLSNAPRPGHILMKGLERFGIPSQGTSIISSGDVVRAELETFTSPHFQGLAKRCYHLGSARNSDILENIPFELTDTIKNAGFILLTAYADEGEDLNQHDPLFEEALKYDIPVICANPDTEIMNGDKLRYCAGVFAERYEKMGGKVHYYGKPHPLVYDVIFKKLEQQNGFDKDRSLMVGDTLETDILGATLAGISSALTKTGNTDLYLLKNQSKGLSESELLANLFRKTNIFPTWVIPGFY